MIYILLPAYNEASSLPNLLKKIKEVSEGKEDYKVIVVNDGSKDNTLEILEKLKAEILLEIVNHKLNRGLGETARDAFERAAEISQPDDIIIRMDADGTHEPKYIPELIKKINEGYDVVIASRFQKGGGMIGVNKYRSLISLAASLVMKIFFPIKNVKDYSCGFRAYRAKIIKEAIRIFGNSFIDLKGMGFTGTVEKIIKLRMLGAKMAEIPFQLRYDQKIGKSKMVTSITTLGYLMLILKNIYPWGNQAKEWQKEIKKLKK
ncbi:MAG: glycosyltransferase family 2 protein [Candidatus Pacebacteria bacterium]|nr:glycosyltransferase family 2 protein [Candidatus Paceibacterota bacterium]